MLEPDLDQAALFLETIVGDGGLVTLQTFDDSPDKRGQLVRVRHGRYGRNEIDLAELTDLNNRGAGIFLCVNETNGRGRLASDIVAVRALFVDLDRDAPDPEWHITPDLIVRSGGKGRLHAYWVLAPGTPLDAFGPAQRSLALHYGGDAVSDLPRVMRLPGFFHRKREPAVMTTVEVPVAA